MDDIQQIIPRVPDFQPVVNQLAGLLHELLDALKLINTTLYINGFMHGMAFMATLLTAIWAFSRKT